MNIENYYLTSGGDLVFESYDESSDAFLVVGTMEQEVVCHLFDMLLADFRCQIVDRLGHRHCHRCGTVVGPLSSHACANEALTSTHERLNRAAGVTS